MRSDMSNDPRQHAEHVKNMLNDVINHLHEDESKVQDPKALALFETSAEVLRGLVTSFDHFEKRSEAPWK